MWSVCSKLGSRWNLQDRWNEEGQKETWENSWLKQKGLGWVVMRGRSGGGRSDTACSGQSPYGSEWGLCALLHTKPFFLFMLLLTLIHIPDNTVHLSESCGEDFGSPESDAMLPAPAVLSHCQFVCCCSTLALILTDQPVYAVRTWLYLHKKTIHTHSLQSMVMLCRQKKNGDFPWQHVDTFCVVLNWLKVMQMQARCDQAWILPKAEWHCGRWRTWWICLSLYLLSLKWPWGRPYHPCRLLITQRSGHVYVGAQVVTWVQVTVDICMEVFLLNFVFKYAIRSSVNVSISVKATSWISLCGALNILVDTVQVVQETFQFLQSSLPPDHRSVVNVVQPVREIHGLLDVVTFPSSSPCRSPQ